MHSFIRKHGHTTFLGKICLYIANMQRTLTVCRYYGMEVDIRLLTARQPPLGCFTTRSMEPLIASITVGCGTVRREPSPKK